MNQSSQDAASIEIVRRENDTIRRLQGKLQKKKLVVVVGAGVTLSATAGEDGRPLSHLTWTGLIRHGLNYLIHEDNKKASDLRAERAFQALTESATSSLLEAAGTLSDLMSECRQFPTWLDSVFSSLDSQVRHPAILEVLRDLHDAGATIITTNYDDLLEQTCKLPRIGRSNQDEILKFKRGDLDGIFHVHGSYQDPAEVVLNSKHYYEVTHDNEVQNILQTFLEYHTIVFVGCGSGLDDPNFGSLLQWISDKHVNIPNRHCLLVRNDDSLNHKALIRLKYGPGYDDLVPFLRRLLDGTIVQTAGQTVSKTTYQDTLGELAGARLGLLGANVTISGSVYIGLSSDMLREEIRFSKRQRTISQDYIEASTAANIIESRGTMSQDRICLVPQDPNKDFVPRPGVADKIVAHVDSAPGSRLALYGLGGTGKSQVALDYAYHIRHKYPDTSIIWIYAGSEDSYRQGYQAVAKAVHLPGYDDPATSIVRLVNAYLESPKAGRWLLIIDNADDRAVFRNLQEAAPSITKPDNAFVENIIPRKISCTVLFTTRDRQLGLDLADGGPLIPVPVMSPMEAESLFMRKSRGIASDPQSVEKLVNTLDCLPLAIVQAAALIQYRTMAVREYLDQYQSTSSAPLELFKKEFVDRSRPQNGTNAVFKTLAVSFEYITQTNKRAAEMLSLISFFDHKNIPEVLIREQAGSLDNLYDSLGLLRGFSLLTTTANSKALNLHRLSRICIHGWLENRGQYVYWANQAILIMTSVFPTSEPENWPLASALLPHAQSLLQACENHSLGPQVRLLRVKLADYLDMQGDYDTAEMMCRKSMDPANTNEFDNLAAMSTLARILRHQGKYSNAEEICRQALAIREGTFGPQHEDTLASCSDLAEILWDQSNITMAEEMINRAFEGRKQLRGDRDPKTMQSETDLVLLYWLHGRFLQAKSMIQNIIERQEVVLGAEHRDTIRSIHILASMSEEQGKLREAEKSLQRVYESRVKNLGENHPETLDSLLDLAWNSYKQGNHDKAMQLQMNAIPAFRTVVGSGHPLTLECDLLRVRIMEARGKFMDAELLCRKLLQEAEKVHGSNHVTTVHLTRCLTEVMLEQSKYSEAESLSRRCTQVLESSLGFPHAYVLTTYDSLCTALQAQHKLDEAEVCARRILEIKTVSWGSKHPYTSSSRNNLAGVLRDQAKYQEAEQLYREALREGEELQTSYHPDNIIRRSNLAGVLKDQAKYKEAEQLYRQALREGEEVQGSQHPSTITRRSNLAGVLRAQAKYKEAEQLFRQALKEREEVQGSRHPDTITSRSNLALILSRQRQYPESEQLCRRVLEEREGVLGIRHRNTLNSGSNLACILQAENKYDEAEQLCRRVLRDREQELGPRHPDTIASRSILASIFESRDRYEEAEQLYRLVLEEQEQEMGPRHPDTIDSRSSLASILEDQEKYEEAERLYRQVLQEREQEMGPRHPDTIASRSAFANILENQARYEEAELLYRQALEEREEVLGLQHPHTLSSLSDLALLQSKRGKHPEAERLGFHVMTETERLMGKCDPVTLIRVSDLALIRGRSGRLEDIDDLVQRSTNDEDILNTSTGARIMNSLYHLSLELRDQKRFERAEDLIRKTLKYREDFLGPMHHRTLKTVLTLACLLNGLQRDAEALRLFHKAFSGFKQTLGDKHEDTIECLDHFSSLVDYIREGFSDDFPTGEIPQDLLLLIPRRDVQG